MFAIKYSFFRLITIVCILLSFNVAVFSSTEHAELHEPILIKVLLQFHPSPFPEDNNDPRKLELISISENYTIDTLRLSKTNNPTVIVEGVYRKGSFLKPEKLSISDLSKSNNKRITGKISEFCNIYGFEEIQSLESAIDLLTEMKSAVNEMKIQEKRYQLLASQMKVLANKMKNAAINMGKNKNADDSKVLQNEFNKISLEFDLTKEKFNNSLKIFNEKEKQYFVNEPLFRSFILLRSIKAIQSAIQIASNEKINEVFIIIGSEHWEDFISIEKRISGNNLRRFKLQKLEPDFGINSN